jgi:serine/threonine-protein phosphatase 2A regulatory subunit A
MLSQRLFVSHLLPSPGLNRCCSQRLASIQELTTIATALGPARTRTELLPYISDCVDDEDENIVALCGQLANFVPLVGGADHASCMLPVYEAVASGEEVALRKLAIDGITTLAGVMPAAHVRTHLFEVVKRLAKGQWYAQRSSVCGLFHVVFPTLDAAGQQEVLGCVQGLSGDSAVMVRRSLAENLKELIPLCSQEALTTVVHPVFIALCKDDQDSVRLLAVALCVPLAESLEAAAVATAVIPVYSAAVADTAWRVRYVAADRVTGFQLAIGPELTKSVLLPAYVALLGDSEAEVRTAACRRLLVFSQALPEATRANAIVEALIVKIQERVVDTNEHVRSALAGVIMGLSAILGKSNTIQYLLPLFLTLLKDDIAEVRLNIISNLDEVNKVVGIQQLATALQPAINELAQHDEWRVRQQIIEHTPLVSKQLGVAFFDEHLCVD